MLIILAFEARYLNASMVAYNQTKHSMLCVVLHLVQNAVIMWLHELCKMSMLWYSTFLFCASLPSGSVLIPSTKCKLHIVCYLSFCVDVSVVWFGSIHACKKTISSIA